MKEIIWTNPIDGRTGITIPSLGLVWVEADSVGQPTVFREFLNDIPGETSDKFVPAVPADGDLPGVDSYVIPAKYRQATAEEIAAKDMPDVLKAHGIPSEVEVPYYVVSREKSMSMDGYFFDAWVHNQGDLSVDMTKAVEVQKEKLRQERAPLLAEMDMLQVMAMIKGDTAKVTEFENYKQELRDVTDHPEIAAAQTLEELKIAGKSVIENELFQDLKAVRNSIGVKNEIPSGTEK